MIRNSVLIAISLLLVACGVYTRYQGSKPVLAEELQGAQIIKLGRLDLNIRAYNDVRDFHMINSAILIPVYISGKDEAIYEGEQEFFVLFAYQPHEKGFELDTTKIQLLSGERKFDASLEQHWTNPAPSKGSEWTGFCGRPVPEGYERISRKPVPESETELWHCYKLKFDLPPPAPTEVFGLNISGMSQAGSPYPIPTIWFEDYPWVQADSVP